jgi:ubiquinone/menaquinone biosynthesis C-methylase UbiE
MYTRLRETVPRPDGPARVLSISGSRKLVERLELPTGEVVEADYPKHDLLNLKFADDSFDYLVVDQVLEHIEGDPFRAAAESLRVVRPGAYVVHTTCLINPIHGAPHDYWRFTPHAYAYFSLKRTSSKWAAGETGQSGATWIWDCDTSAYPRLTGIRCTEPPFTMTLSGR